VTRSFVRPIRVPEHVPLETAQPDHARAGESGRWLLPFTLCRRVQAGPLYLYLHGKRNNPGIWETLQANDPDGPEYIRLRRASGEPLRLLDLAGDGSMAVFEVPARGLPQGERLVAELRGRAPHLSLPNKFFLLLDASPETWPCAHTIYGEALSTIVAACLVHVVGGETAGLAAHAPSTVRPGEPFSVLVRGQDIHGNVSSQPLGDITVQVGGNPLPAERQVVPDSTCCRLEGLMLPDPGIYRLEIACPALGLTAIANPILCQADEQAPLLLWGMIHGHTEHSDGAGSLDHYFAYMRDECALDFGATGDHDHLFETSEEMWQRAQETVVRYNQPGRFTTFLGYEWAKWRHNGDGDRNVYYLNDCRPMYRSDDPCYPTPGDLFRTLRDEVCLVIPHHPAEVGNHCDWKDHDPDRERLVEIYSCWGNSERSMRQGNPYPVIGWNPDRPDSGEVPAGFVQRALALGWRVGFTAGGDDHVGHAGDQVKLPVLRPTATYRAGLMAAWAAGNTRRALWEALGSRRCYATTGARILLDFEINGRPMGSELSRSTCLGLDRRRVIRVTVHGTDRLLAVEVVRNNVDVRRWEPDGPDVHLQWTDTQPLAAVDLPPAPFCREPFTFYYLRITQANGEMAWASPIWVLA